MLVYATSFRCRGGGSARAALDSAARWLSRRAGSLVSGATLSAVNSLRLENGARLQTWATTTEHPFLYALRFTHDDREVPGREWRTELGIEDPGGDAPVSITVLLETHEISARISSPVSTSRPQLVEALIGKCAPLPETPGLFVKSLSTGDSARAFDYLVTDSQRKHPLVVISPTPSGEYLVDPERARLLVATLADVIKIPPDVDTFALADSLGKEHVAWRGGINILFTPRVTPTERFVPRVRLLPEQLQDLTAEGRSAEAELLAIITHRTNLSKARDHIRPEHVNETSLNRQIYKRRGEAASAESLTELLTLYDEAHRESAQRIQQLESHNIELECRLNDLDDERRSLTFQIEGLKANLFSLGSPDRTDTAAGSFDPSRDVILAALRGKASLESCLQVVQCLFSDRVVILDSAWKSARESQTFSNVSRALELLLDLVTSYWETLSIGRPDSEARKVFGNAYAAKESESVENNHRARELRTFHYDGSPIVMWKHLKIGVKPSKTETLRIHFHWDSAKVKLVVGHCGPHLDHG